MKGITEATLTEDKAPNYTSTTTPSTGDSTGSDRGMTTGQTCTTHCSCTRACTTTTGVATTCTIANTPTHNYGKSYKTIKRLTLLYLHEVFNLILVALSSDRVASVLSLLLLLLLFSLSKSTFPLYT